MRITTTLAVLAIAAMPGLTAVVASPDDPEWEREKTALIAMLGKEPTTEQVSTSLDWGRCLNRFVEQFAPQEEEIGTIAEAVINACMIEMEAYLTAFQPIQDVVLRARARSKLISRIREIRSNAADK
jgi:hypothetical protein